MKKRFLIRDEAILCLVIFFWTFFIAGLFLKDWFDIEGTIMDVAKKQAESAYNKDLSYRIWGAMVGGVYVSTDKVKPNPYLSFLKNRDVVTKDGQRLTLVNPAYMTRLVYETAKKRYGIFAHIVSLRPLNPENTPDQWEKAALLAFEKGKENETYCLVNVQGKQYFKYMRAFYTEQECLKCHSQQGYKVGDLRGGISILLPFDGFAATMSKRRYFSAFLHSCIFVAGLMVILITAFFIRENKKALSESEERLRSLMNAMPDIVCFKDHEGRWLEANSYDLKLFELEGVDYKGKKDSELAQYSEFYQEAFLKCEESDELAWQKGEPIRADEKIPLRQGGYKIYDVIKVPIFDPDGSRKGLLVVGRDVTEQRFYQAKAEKISKLKGLILGLSIDFINISGDKSQELFRKSLSQVGEYLEVDRAIFWTMDQHSRGLFISTEWTRKEVEARGNRCLGIDSEQLASWIKENTKRDFVILDREDPDSMDSIINFFLGEDTKSSVIFPVTDGGGILGVISLEWLREIEEWDEDYIPLLKLLSAIYANAICRLNIYKQLQESERKYRELFERIPIGLYQSTPGPKGKFIMVNKAMVKMFGYENEEAMLGIEVNDLYNNKSHRLHFLEMLAEKGIIENHEMRLRKSDGSPIWVSVTARFVKDPLSNAIHFEGAVQDITKRKKVEEEKRKLQSQLQQAQKLESVGRLAGGVAHDLNNLLVPILGYNELLLQGFDKSSKEYGYLSRVIEAAEKAKDIVRRLLAFSRQDVIDPEPVDLNKILVNFEKLLRRTIREDIEITMNLSPELPTVNADKIKLEQVILNLAVNAQDAMPEGGVLSFETSLVHLDGEHISQKHQGVTPGPYVCLVVSDTGHGMDKETMKRIFDPFFTTKPKDAGTGLGLAMVYGIIKQHGGTVRVYSELGKGTTFKIYLPVSGGKESTEETEQKPIPKDLYGSATVLLVEDNHGARRLVRDTLGIYGYKVIEARSPQEAIDLMNSFTEKPDLLLTDVIMPEMNGKELYEALSRRFPGLKVVFMSGYTENVISEHGILKKGTYFISKPFTQRELLTIIKEALSG